jgi:hypothetical protein
MSKKQVGSGKYTTVVSLRLTREERDKWLATSDKLGMSGNRFFAKAITEYIAMIEQPASQPLKIPPYLKYCREIRHGGDGFFKE